MTFLNVFRPGYMGGPRDAHASVASNQAGPSEMAMSPPKSQQGPRKSEVYCSTMTLANQLWTASEQGTG